MKIGPDPRRSPKVPAAPRKTAGPGRINQTPRQRSQNENYDQLLGEAIRATRVDFEAQARRRREQRRRNNVLWLGGVLLVCIVLGSSWALLARRGTAPAAEVANVLTAGETASNATDNAVTDSAAGNTSEMIVGTPDNATSSAVSTPGTTIPVEIRLISKAGSEAMSAVLSTSKVEYKVVGKGEISEAEVGADGEMSVAATLSSGSTLEVCPGESCGEKRLPDEHAQPDDVLVQVVADAPYALCARDTDGSVQRLAQFRARVKVNPASGTP